MKKKHLILILLMGCMTLKTANAQQTTNSPKQNPSNPPASETNRSNTFSFDGGNLESFVQEIQRVYKIDLKSEATIPKDALYSVRVPKMKTSGRFPSPLLLYNSMAERGVPGMGRWVLIGTNDDQSSIGNIAFVPPDSASAQSVPVKSKAFDYKISSNQELQQLTEVINSSCGAWIDQAMSTFNRESDSHQTGLSLPTMPKGHIRYHEPTQILFASGDENYLDIVTQIVEVMQERKDSAVDKQKK